MKHNIGEEVTVKITGTIKKIETSADGEIRYYVDREGYNYAIATEDQIVELRYECEHCGREFKVLKTLIANTSPDGDKISVCQECYDHAMNVVEPDYEPEGIET